MTSRQNHRPRVRAFFLKNGISTSRPVQFPGICTDRPVQLPYCQNFHPSMPVKYGIRTDHEHRNFHRPVCCKCLGAETPTDRSVQIPVVYLARNLAQTDPCICSEYGRTADTDRSRIFGASMGLRSYVESTYLCDCVETYNCVNAFSAKHIRFHVG